MFAVVDASFASVAEAVSLFSSTLFGVDCLFHFYARDTPIAMGYGLFFFLEKICATFILREVCYQVD